MKAKQRKQRKPKHNKPQYTYEVNGMSTEKQYKQRDHISGKHNIVSNIMHYLTKQCLTEQYITKQYKAKHYTTELCLAKQY